MRNFEIKFTEYKAIIFGDGIKKIDTETGATELSALKKFIKRKKATGSIAVINSMQHIPNKEQKNNEGVKNYGKDFKSFAIASS